MKSRGRHAVFLFLILSAFALLAAGCTPQIVYPADGPTRIVQDDEGTIVQVPVYPKRIITLTSGYDTILLGLIEPDRLAAVSSLTKYEGYSLDWKRARQVKVALRSYPLETIMQLKPDLVIAPEYTSKDTIDGIRGMGIPVVVITNGKTVQGALTTIARIADMVNESEKGAELIGHVNQAIALMAEKIKLIPPGQEKTVLFLSSMDGYAGTGSMFADMCRYMGVRNGPEVKQYPERTSFTDERILDMNPDFIFIPTYQPSDKAWLERIAHNPAFQSMKAVKEHHVLPMKAAYLYTTNQHIGEAMLSIMKVVYPELFSKAEGGAENGEANKQAYKQAYKQKNGGQT